MSADEQAVDLAERVVLGAALSSSEAAEEVQVALDHQDYRSARHGAVHDALGALLADARPHDVTAVADELDKRGELGRVGGISYLFELVTACTVPSQAAWYAETVKEAAKRRGLNALGEKLKMVSAQDGSVDDIVDESRRLVDSFADSGTVEEVDSGTAIRAAIESLDEPAGAPTPWPSVTETIGGLQPGRMIVCAARPSVGKSVLALEAALHTARTGRTAIVWCMEMSANELWLRLLSNAGAVDGQRIQRRDLRDTDYERLEAAAQELRSLPLIVKARPTVNLSQIGAHLRTVKRESNVGLVVVDYLALMQAPAHLAKSDERVKIGELARGCKVLSSEHEVPFLVLSQLNRGGVGSEAQLDNLAKSDDIGAHADVVMIMHRELDPEKGDPSDAYLNVVKNRSGPTRHLQLTFQGHYSRLTEPPSWT